MRWFTCTPVAFSGGADFFARDSGLLSRAFQALGIESKAVMPTPASSYDEPDLIRVAPEKLESVDWWESQELDGVVLYAWARPRFRKVAKAIHDAGIFLVLNQDAGGYISPREGLGCWARMESRVAGATANPRGFITWMARIVKGMTYGLFFSDPWRARHLQCGDIIACVCPLAADRFKRLCFVYGGKILSDRVRVVPHPVETEFRHQGDRKERRVVSIARWDDEVQKRPGLMVNVISQLMSRDGGVHVDIIGDHTEYLQAWHRGLEESVQRRVLLHGRIPREQIAKVLRTAQVFYSSSAYESFGIAAAEALCSGCSVVAERSIAMPSFEWFVAYDSGSLCESDSAKAHAETLYRELGHWELGRRSANAIAEKWNGKLHAPQVARRILHLKSNA